MNYFNLTIKDKEYKLVLTTRGVCDLENKLGKNPINLLVDAGNGTIPKVQDMVNVLWASAQKYNHGLSVNDCYELFDDYIADGHSYVDFINVILEIYKISGLIAEENEEESPN